MKTKEELQAIYFGFYDQLPEPWRSEAKENWDYEFANYTFIPETVDEAIIFGWPWRRNDEVIKWTAIHGKLLNGEIQLNQPSFTPTLSDIKNQLDRVEVLLNKLTNNK